MTYTGLPTGDTIELSYTPAWSFSVTGTGSVTMSGDMEAAPTGQLDSAVPLLSWSIQATTNGLSVQVFDSGVEDPTTEAAIASGFSFDASTGVGNFDNSNFTLSADYTVPGGVTSVDTGGGTYLEVDDASSATPAPGCVPVMLAGLLPGATVLMRRRIRRRI
jgi:hypothetical protein